MGGTGAVAICVAGQGFAVAFKLAARGWPVFVDAAADRSAYVAQQCSAASRPLFGASHATVDIIDLASEIVRHHATGTLGFTPVKGHAEKTATGPTGQARRNRIGKGIRHGHYRRLQPNNTKVWNGFQKSKNTACRIKHCCIYSR